MSADRSAEAEAAGMTLDEAEAWDLVARAAGACLRLANRPGSHPMSREEFCHAFHVIQDRLAALPTLRRMGLEAECDGDGPDEAAP